jgi:hypothetical protein
MLVAFKNGVSKSILAYRLHIVSDVLIGPSILSVLCRGSRVNEWYKSVHFGVRGSWK